MSFSPEYLADFSKKIRADMPIANYMGLEVVSFDDHSATVRAPISPNLNDKKTAFGGSLYSICTVGCWSLVALNLAKRDLTADIIIYDSQMKYFKPLTEDIEATCTLAEGANWDDFNKSIDENGKAKIAATAEVKLGDEQANAYAAKFAVILRQ